MFNGVKLFADGASIASIDELAQNKHIDGFTTNPTLMRKAGVTDYRAFALEALAVARKKPISFEVIADNPELIQRQAFHIASWGSTVYVKVPIMTTYGESLAPVIGRLARGAVKVNVTAVFTTEQVLEIIKVMPTDAKAIISVFAGRIADAGQNPVGVMRDCVAMVRKARPNIELLWASPRQVFDACLAAKEGVDIITMTPDLLNKLNGVGKNLTQFSRETVEMFYNDALAAGLTIDLPEQPAYHHEQPGV